MKRKNKPGARSARTTAPPSAVPRRGRPALERDTTVKTGVVLFARHLSYLDRLCLDIRDASGRPITRSDALRGIVEGVAASGVDLTKAATEDEIAALIRGKLAR